MGTDREILRERVLDHLKTKAENPKPPNGSNKETMRELLLTDIDQDGNDLAEVLSILCKQKWIHLYYRTYTYITDEKIAEISKKRPGFKEDVLFARTGELPESKKGSKTEPFTSDWCKATIQSPAYQAELKHFVIGNTHEMFRLLSRIGYGDVSHLPMDTPEFDTDLALRQARRLEAFLHIPQEIIDDWADEREQ